MDERRLETRVGLLVFAGMAGLVALLYLMGELRRFSAGPTLNVDFSHTGNVANGAPVKLGGVQVGRVEGIRLIPERRDANGEPLPVVLELSVEDEALAALHSDASVTVATVGPLGEPYLELNPGTSSLKKLERGATLRGQDAPRLDVVFAKLNAFLDAASRILEDDPQALRNLVNNISSLSRRLDVLIAENQGDVRILAAEVTATVRDVRALATLGRKALEPGGDVASLLHDGAETARVMRRDLPIITQNAGRALGGIAAVTGEFTAEDGARARAALLQLESVSARTERILARIERGEGTLGALQKDEKLVEDLRALVTDLKAHPWKMLWKN